MANLSDDFAESLPPLEDIVPTGLFTQCMNCKLPLEELELREEILEERGKQVIDEVRERHEQLDRDEALINSQFGGFKAAADARTILVHEMRKGLAIRMRQMRQDRNRLATVGYCPDCLAEREEEKRRIMAQNALAADEDYTSLAEFLADCGLSDRLRVFQQEKITLFRLVNLRDEYFKELGLRVGERQALQDAIRRYRHVHPELLINTDAEPARTGPRLSARDVLSPVERGGGGMGGMGGRGQQRQQAFGNSLANNNNNNNKPYNNARPASSASGVGSEDGRSMSTVNADMDFSDWGSAR